MKILTLSEYENIKIYELPNNIYNAIERKLTAATNETVAKKLLNKWLEKKLKDITCNSNIDFMSCFQIIG
jgi:hypothetical protein